MEDTEELIRACSSIDKIEDCLGALIDSAIAKKKAVLHIYHSANREIYETYLWKICDHVVNAYIDTVLGGRKISESDLGIIKKYLSDVGYGLVSGWLKSGMTEDIRSDFARICEIKKGTVEMMISRCEEK